MQMKILLTGSAIALGAAMLVSVPASAQEVCLTAPTNGAAAGTATGNATGAESLACGDTADANGAGSVAIGDADAIGVDTIAVGNGAVAQNTTGIIGSATDDNIAIGSGALGTGVHATSIGGDSSATGLGSTAIGWEADATAANTTALGNSAEAIGAQATAIGRQTNAAGIDSTALGQGAGATMLNSTALGQGAQAIHTNSVALGADTTTTAANQVNVGGRTIGGVANGVLATDAVNVSQLTAFTDGLDVRVDTLEALALDFDSRLDRLNNRVAAAGAVASALSGAAFLPGKSFNITGNVATYDGAHAGAILLGAMIGDNMAFTAGVSHGFNKGGKTAARAGVTFGW